MSKLIEETNILESKLNLLLERYVFLKEENEVLHQQLIVKQNQLIDKQQTLKDINNKYDLLKVAKTIEGSNENSRETKLKINNLIREIDKCIVQLSE